MRSRIFFGRLLGSLLKTGILLMKMLRKPLAESVLIPLRLIAADAGIHKKVHGSGTATLLTSNKEKEDIMKIVRSNEESGILLIKVVHKTI